MTRPGILLGPPLYLESWNGVPRYSFGTSAEEASAAANHATNAGRGPNPIAPGYRMAPNSQTRQAGRKRCGECKGASRPSLLPEWRFGHCPNPAGELHMSA